MTEIIDSSCSLICIFGGFRFLVSMYNFTRKIRSLRYFINIFHPIIFWSANQGPIFQFYRLQRCLIPDQQISGSLTSLCQKQNTCYSMNKPQRQYANWCKPLKNTTYCVTSFLLNVQKRPIFFFFLYLQKTRTEHKWLMGISGIMTMF